MNCSRPRLWPWSPQWGMGHWKVVGDAPHLPPFFKLALIHTFFVLLSPNYPLFIIHNISTVTNLNFFSKFLLDRPIYVQNCSLLKNWSKFVKISLFDPLFGLLTEWPWFFIRSRHSVGKNLTFMLSEHPRVTPKIEYPLPQLVPLRLGKGPETRRGAKRLKLQKHDFIWIPETFFDLQGTLEPQFFPWTSGLDQN